MRKLLFYFLVIPGTAVLMGINGLLWAQPPAISIDLTFNKYSYNYGDPVGVDIVVRNLGGEVLISRGFSSMVYCLEMRVMDPAGRLLLAKRNVEHNEFLMLRLYHLFSTKVAPFESLPARFYRQAGLHFPVRTISGPILQWSCPGFIRPRFSFRQ